MPFDAPANGPDWSVSTPSVIVSSVTPGPTSSAVAPASPPSAVADGSSSLVEQAAATTTRTAASHSRAWRRTSGTELLDMGSLLEIGVKARRPRAGGGDVVAQGCGRRRRSGLDDAFVGGPAQPAPGPPAEGGEAAGLDQEQHDDGGAVAKPGRDACGD